MATHAGRRGSMPESERPAVAQLLEDGCREVRGLKASLVDLGSLEASVRGAIRRLSIICDLMPDQDDSTPPAEPPGLPESPPAFRHLEEAHRGFFVTPTQAADPSELLGPVGGMPAPEPMDAVPDAPPAPPASADNAE